MMLRSRLCENSAGLVAGRSESVAASAHIGHKRPVGAI